MILIFSEQKSQIFSKNDLKSFVCFLKSVDLAGRTTLKIEGNRRFRMDKDVLERRKSNILIYLILFYLVYFI